METQPKDSLRPKATFPRSTRCLVAGLLTSLLVATLAVGATVSASAVHASTSESQKGLAPGTYEKRVQHWINVKRRQHDLRSLRFAACPDGTAERWSRYLARHDLFYHQSMQRILARCNATYAGETLGRGAISPRRLVRMWMRSDSHRHVLLSRQARRFGVGAHRDDSGQWVVAADFVRF